MTEEDIHGEMSYDGYPEPDDNHRPWDHPGIIAKIRCWFILTFR